MHVPRIPSNQPLVRATASPADVQPARRTPETAANASGPSVGSPIGLAVAEAVARTRRGTVDPAAVRTAGRVEAIWVNDLSPANEGIGHVVEEIAKAEHEVCIQAFAWDYGSEACEKLMSALAARQRENPDFKVYIAYDRDFLPWGGMREALKRFGVKAEVAGYSDPLNRGSNHTKMFVIDGHTAITGGANIQSKAEKDVFVKVTGPVVKSFLADFDDAWVRSRYWLGADGTKTSQRQPAPTHRVAPAPEPTGAPAVMTVLTKKGGHLDGPNRRDNDANQGLLAAYAAAKHSIKIESPNCNDVDVWDALAAAAKRGVKVQVVLAKGFNQMRSQFDRANNDRFLRFVAQLPPEVASNIEMRWYSEDGKQTHHTHAKYMSVDGQWAYVGSQNMDNQSWAWSREFGLGIDDSDTTRRLDEAIFDRHWQTSLPARHSWLHRLLAKPARDWNERVRSWADPRNWISEIM